AAAERVCAVAADDLFGTNGALNGVVTIIAADRGIGFDFAGEGDFVVASVAAHDQRTDGSGGESGHGTVDVDVVGVVVEGDGDEGGAGRAQDAHGAGGEGGGEETAGFKSVDQVHERIIEQKWAGAK